MASFSRNRPFTVAGRVLSPTLLFVFLAWPVRPVPPATVPAFTASRVYPVGQAPFGIVVADFNGDGKPDLATVNEGSNDVTVLVNTGMGTYLSAANYIVGTDPVSIGVGEPGVIKGQA